MHQTWSKSLWLQIACGLSVIQIQSWLLIASDSLRLLSLKARSTCICEVKDGTWYFAPANASAQIG